MKTLHALRLVALLALSAFVLSKTLIQIQNLIAGEVPSQSDIAKDGAWKYFKNLPKHAGENILALLKMDDFQLLKFEHHKNPAKSAFRLFKANSYRRNGGMEWTYPFVNSGGVFKDIMKVEYGLCAGFTVSLRKFQMLSYFDPTNKEKQQVPNKTSDPDGYFEFMKEKIDLIMERKIAIIPGFKNIREFASEPRIAEYIKKQIINQWQLTNVNVMQGIFQGMGGTQKEITPAQVKELHAELSERLKMGFNPIVYLAKKSDKLFSSKQWIHVLQVTNISDKKSDGSFTVGVLDINYNYATAGDANKVVEFKADKPSYKGEALSNVIRLRWDDLEVTHMVKQNLEFCIDRPGFCTGDPVND